MVFKKHYFVDWILNFCFYLLLSSCLVTERLRGKMIMMRLLALFPSNSGSPLIHISGLHFFPPLWLAVVMWLALVHEIRNSEVCLEAWELVCDLPCLFPLLWWLKGSRLVAAPWARFGNQQWHMAWRRNKLVAFNFEMLGYLLLHHNPAYLSCLNPKRSKL